MYRITVTMADQTLFTLPPVDSVPTYNEVRRMLIDYRVKGRIRGIDVRHIFKGRTVARLYDETGEIEDVDAYFEAFGFDRIESWANANLSRRS